MSILLAIVVVGIGTYISRAVFILAFANKPIPESVITPLQFVAPAVLAALVVALLIDETGSVAIGVPEAMALTAGAVVAWISRNHVYTLFVGMGVFWIIRDLI